MGMTLDSRDRETLTAIRTPPPFRFYFKGFDGSTGCVSSDLSSLNNVYLFAGKISLSEIYSLSQVSFRIITSQLCL